MARDIALVLTLMVTGCSDSAFDAQGELHQDIRTVVEISWEPLGGGQAWVEYGPDPSFGQLTPPVPDGPGRSSVLLLGNKPFQEVYWRVVAEQDGQIHVGQQRSTQTEGLPASMPDFQLEHSDGSFEGWVMGVSWAETNFLYVLDADAEVVWYQQIPIGTVSLSVDPVPGDSALRYLRVGLDHALDSSEVVTMGLDGQEREAIDAEQGHHSFVAHDDGTLAWLAIDVQEHKDHGDMVGDRVLQRSPDGAISQIYSTWDHFEYDAAVTLDANFYPQGVDWTHSNTLSHAPARSSYWLTMGGVDKLVEIHQDSGEVMTVVGTDGYPFEPAIDDFGMGYGPHGATWTSDDSLLLFDNNATPEAKQSRVLEYALDDHAGVAREIWRYEAPEGVLARVLGGADRIDEGWTFVHWGNSGYLNIVDRDGAEIWAAQQGSIIADAVVLGDLYGRD
jgi:hypothetical protein